MGDFNISRIRTRYAPSPADRVHAGDSGMALYAYLIARHEGGDFFLRIEDTDQERFAGGAAGIIYQTPEDMGLIHDEGPDKGGRYGPYVQSERQASNIYLEYARELVEKGEAYYYFCTPERLTSLRTVVNGEETMIYGKHCLHLSKEEVEANLATGMPYVIRQNNPATGTTAFQDKIHGGITMDSSELDDMVLIKSNGYPTYNFVNVADDHLMGVTHVIRGNEYLSSSPRYNRPYVAFRWDVSVYTHCPLITGESHHKLNKRSGHSSFEDLLERGSISQAVVNYAILLGWSPEGNQGIFSLEEMVKEFDHHRMNKSPAVLDMTKFKRMNGEYMKATDFDTFCGIAKPYLKAVVSKDLDLRRIVAMVKTRIEIFPDIADHVNFFEALPEYSTVMYTYKRMRTNTGTSFEALTDVLPLLEAQDDFTNDTLYGVLSKYAKDTRVKTGLVTWPIRIAVSGKQMTPAGATEIMEVLGKEESLAKVRKEIQMLEVQESSKWYLTMHKKRQSDTRRVLC